MVGAIRFGARVSVSGKYALQGRQVLAGLRAWVEGHERRQGSQRARGPTAGSVRLVYYNDASLPAKAAATPSGSGEWLDGA